MTDAAEPVVPSPAAPGVNSSAAALAAQVLSQTTAGQPGTASKAPEVKALYTTQHKTACRSVTYSLDGRFCATGCADGTIKVLDCAKMRVCAAAVESPLGRARL